MHEDLILVADKYAAEQDRSLSNYIEHAVRNDLKRRGVKVPPVREIEAMPAKAEGSEGKIGGVE